MLTWVEEKGTLKNVYKANRARRPHCLTYCRKPSTVVYICIYIICIYYIEWGVGRHIMELQRRDSETFDRWDVLWFNFACQSCPFFTHTAVCVAEWENAETAKTAGSSAKNIVSSHAPVASRGVREKEPQRALSLRLQLQQLRLPLSLWQTPSLGGLRLNELSARERLLPVEMQGVARGELG